MSEQHQIIKNSLQPDGGLYWLRGYLSWNVGGRRVTIDGDFTPDELSAIADYMETTGGGFSRDSLKWLFLTILLIFDHIV